MNTKTKAGVFILLIATTSAWAQSSPPPKSITSPTISEIATTFTNYSRITKHAVLVNPELAMQCDTVSTQQIAATSAKFGPHANTTMLIYMNPPAADAFKTNATIFPLGSVVVKQKTILIHADGKGQLAISANSGVGGMVKRPAGYDPAHGDWEYFYFEDPKKIESGKISSCVQCHQSAKEKDYVFGTWRTATK
jgi:hypothetical protein